jgi:hypothetical protein
MAKPASLAHPVARPPARSSAACSRASLCRIAAACTASGRATPARPTLCTATAATPARGTPAVARLLVIAESANQLLELVEAGLQGQSCWHRGSGSTLRPLGRVVGVHHSGRRGEAEQHAGSCPPAAIPPVPSRLGGTLRRGGVATTSAAVTTKERGHWVAYRQWRVTMDRAGMGSSGLAAARPGDRW